MGAEAKCGMEYEDVTIAGEAISILFVGEELFSSPGLSSLDARERVSQLALDHIKRTLSLRKRNLLF